ncbi:hypothetical protein EBZ80_17245 [bacterium]|nr:hypothetical protein [bacterium]
MALSTTELRLAKILYWVAGLGALLYSVYLLFTMTPSRSIVAILWLIAGLMLLYILYPYYFPPGDPSARWPPYITVCPDYLTQIAPGACVDFVGLNSPLLKKSDPANPPAPTDTNYVFTVPRGATVPQKAALAQQYGLSWEGVI